MFVDVSAACCTRIICSLLHMPPNKYPMVFKSLQNLAALEPETYDDLEVKYPITNPLSHAVGLIAGDLGDGIWSRVTSQHQNLMRLLVLEKHQDLDMSLNSCPEYLATIKHSACSLTQCLKGNSSKLLYLWRWKPCGTKFHNTKSSCKGFAVHKDPPFWSSVHFFPTTHRSPL